MHNNVSDSNLALYSTAMCNLTSFYLKYLERRDGGFKFHPFMIVANTSAFL